MKLFVGIFSLFLIIFPLNAKVHGQGNFNFDIEPSVSYTNGTLGEIFYQSKLNDESRKRSYLEWDRNIFMFGINLLGSFKNFHADLGFSSSIFNQNSGKMGDSDWLNIYDYSMKTTYSTGTNEAVSNYEAFIKMYYDFKTDLKFKFSPIIGLRYNFDSFERQSAEGWYGQSSYTSDGQMHWWSDDEAQHLPYTYWSDEKNKYVTVGLGPIEYYRHSLLTFFGVKAEFSPVSRFSMNFNILLSPFSYFYAVDSHTAQDSDTKKLFKKHYRMIQFSYFNVLNLGAGINYAAGKNITLTLNTDYLFTLQAARGTLYADTFEGIKENRFRNSGQDSGLILENFSVCFGLRLKLK